MKDIIINTSYFFVEYYLTSHFVCIYLESDDLVSGIMLLVLATITTPKMQVLLHYYYASGTIQTELDL